MDFTITSLPPEILEKVFLHLDTQALSACALAEPLFADLIYSSHFLDEYCRTSLCSSWVTAADVCNANIAVPYEFWFWAHVTMKLEDIGQSNIIFHNKYLTKIGTLRHMYIMWLICGLRPTFMASHALLNDIYSLPLTVDEVFKDTGKPKPVVTDTLVKTFLALPEIMDLTCGSLDFFSMQAGSTSSLCMDIVLNEGIVPKLPIGFNSLFSVEIVSASVFGKNPALLILIGESMWVLWLGFLFKSFDQHENTLAETLFCKHFRHTDEISTIRYHAHHSLQDLNGYVYSMRTCLFCPLITGKGSETSSLIISLAQEHHRSLQKKFDLTLYENCLGLAKKINYKISIGGLNWEKVMSILNAKAGHSAQLNKYIIDLMKIDTVKTKKISISQNLSYVISKCVLERITSLFRNEIHFCAINRFCHSFLCGCLESSLSIWSSTDDRVDRCVSEKMKDGLQSPHMWPLHILSAACQAVPVLVEVLESDIHMMTYRGMKYVIPLSMQGQVNHFLQTAGLILTNRPPSKVRCPPLFKQVRLWSVESLI